MGKASARPGKRAWYKSESWLRRKYVVAKMKPEEIAEECGCTTMTIYLYLRKFNLLK